MAEARLWLIGGTHESAQLAQAMPHLPCCITVVTESARRLYANRPTHRIWVGKLEPTTIADFLQQHRIAAILDASHPFAVEISQLAIAAAQTHHIPYLRFERPQINSEHSLIQTVDSLETLLQSGRLVGERVLLSLGYRMLPQFAQWHDRATLFARILPSTEALTTAITAGFTPDRLIALRPPISAELERALWQQWRISLVVTKASGAAGGEDIKQQVATALNVPLVAIARPALTYPKQTHDLHIALEFCQTSLASPHPSIHGVARLQG